MGRIEYILGPGRTISSIFVPLPGPCNIYETFIAKNLYYYSSEFPQHVILKTQIVTDPLLIALKKSNKISIPNERDSVNHKRLEA